MSETVNEKNGSTHPLNNTSTHSLTTHPLTNSSTHPLKTPIIQVKHLSKRYQIGMDRTYKTFCETAVDTIKSPLKRLKSFSRQEEIFWALKDINFEVFPGEVVGIIGRNGAGKTTLLKILSRITHLTEGEVVLRGRVASLLEVGTGFHPELTGRENVYFNGAILGMTKQEIEDKFDEIVEFSGVKDFLDTPLKRYSSGMQVRLAFAVAAHLDPEILVVDEVLAVGDAEFQKKCLGKMKDVSEGGRTVLFVSHNMLSIQNLCTRGILLESGQISMEGSITDVINKYLDLGGEQSGEVCWASPDVAPGNERVRLKAVRIVSEDHTTGVVDISKEFRIEVDYWNLEADARRLVSIHLHNSMGICLLTSGNSPSASLTPDPWYTRSYPPGLFRTSCIIPGCFLNDGPHSVSVFINRPITDSIIIIKDILSFTVQDTGMMRKEFTGKWIGAVRPRLDWHTVQLN